RLPDRQEIQRKSLPLRSAIPGAPVLRRYRSTPPSRRTRRRSSVPHEDASTGAGRRLLPRACRNRRKDSHHPGSLFRNNCSTFHSSLSLLATNIAARRFPIAVYSRYASFKNLRAASAGALSELTAITSWYFLIARSRFFRMS